MGVVGRSGVGTRSGGRGFESVYNESREVR